jgi:hypothetical protein
MSSKLAIPAKAGIHGAAVRYRGVLHDRWSDLVDITSSATMDPGLRRDGGKSRE